MRRMVALLLIPLLLLLIPSDNIPVEQNHSRIFATHLIDGDTETEALMLFEKKPLLKAEVASFQEDGVSLSKLMTVTENEFDYLLSLQDENGIIAQTPGLDHSIPYFSNMAALAMLSDSRGFEPVRRYMDWYLRHINRPDKFGFYGTMYDYRKQGGNWVATHDYDSADSYAATFLTLVFNYATATGDTSFVEDNLQGIVDVAEVLIKLQDKDGLIWAKPKYYVKFLMDNAENYRGLRDAELLMHYFGRADLAERYGQAASLVAQGMEKKLWLEDQQVYAWALYGRWWQRVPKKKWYPDTIGQIYPVVFGVVDPLSDRASHLYAYLNLHYPEWTKGRFDDRFPWTVLALMATMMRDDARAVEYLSNVYESTASLSRGYPWYSFESAFFVKAWNTLGPKYAIPTVAKVTEDDLEDTEEKQEEQETLMITVDLGEDEIEKHK